MLGLTFTHNAPSSLRSALRGRVAVVVATSIIIALGGYGVGGVFRAQSQRAAAQSRLLQFRTADLQPAEAAYTAFVAALPSTLDIEAIEALRNNSPAAPPPSKSIPIANNLRERQHQQAELLAFTTETTASRPAVNDALDLAPLPLPPNWLLTERAWAEAFHGDNNAASRFNALNMRYTPAHPDVKQARAEWLVARHNLESATSKINQRLANDIAELSHAHDRALADEQKQASELRRLAQLASPYEQLRDHRAAARARQNEMIAAIASISPISRDNLPITLGSTAACLFASVWLTLRLCQFLDRRQPALRSARQARRRLSCPVWAEVPHCPDGALSPMSGHS